MKLRRIANPKGWTSIPTKALADDEISFRAAGVLAYLLSRPDGWETDSKRLARGARREGRDAIRTALKELEARGYLHRVKVRRPAGMTLDGRYVGGQITTEYFVSDHPVKHPTEVLELVDELPPDPGESAGDWESGPGAKIGDNSVDAPGDNSTPEPGKPTPENPAPLTRPDDPLLLESQRNPTSGSPQVEESDAGLMAGAAPLGLAALAGDPTSPLGYALEAADLVGAIQRLEPRLQPFALRAHLVEVMGYQPLWQEVYDWVEHAHAGIAAVRRGRVTTAELVAYVASFYPRPEPESSDRSAAAAPPAGLPAGEGPASRPGEHGGIAVPIPAGTSPERLGALDG